MAKKYPLMPLIGLGKQQEFFIENLSMLLNAGVDINSALETIGRETNSWSLRYFVKILNTEIESGASLWKAFEATGIFPDHAISLLRIGEESESLAQNLAILAQEMQKSGELRSKIQSAMMYPVFVLCVMFVIGIGTAWFTLPRLATVLQQMHVPLPIYTQVLMAFGDFLKLHGLVAAPVAIITMILIVYIMFMNSKTKVIGQFLMFRLPGISRAIQEIEISKMGYLLGTLLNAGVPVVDALDSLAKGATFYAYRNFYNDLKKNIADGNSFQKSFKKKNKFKKYVPSSVMQIVSAGEQSGNLANTLLKIGSIYEAKTETTSKNLTTIIEPLLLVITAGAVLCFALAVIMPIYKLVGGLDLNSVNSNGRSSVQQSAGASATGAASVTEQNTQATTDKLLAATDVANLRSGAGTQNSVVRKAKTGEQFNYVDHQNGWYHINLPEGGTAWISEKFVNILK